MTRRMALGAVFAAWAALAVVLAQAPAEDGRALFEGRGQCLTCHAVDGRGGREARDLGWIGVLRTPEKLRAAVANRSAHTMPLTTTDIDALVAYLRTLRTMWRLEPGPSEREIPAATENAPFFDRPDRDKEERPDQLIDALRISPGASVADIGAGTGYFTWRLAQQVGPAGRVYAVDIQPEMLDLARAAVGRHGLRNVEFVLAAPDRLGLPERSIDFAFLAYAYHEFADPEATMGAIRTALKPGGRVLVLEYAKESRIAPASPLHKMSFDEIRREIEPLGFAIDQLLDFLPVQHGVVFTIK